jgi:hypothetical protein
MDKDLARVLLFALVSKYVEYKVLYCHTDNYWTKLKKLGKKNTSAYFVAASLTK